MDAGQVKIQTARGGTRRVVNGETVKNGKFRVPGLGSGGRDARTRDSSSFVSSLGSVRFVVVVVVRVVVVVGGGARDDDARV